MKYYSSLSIPDNLALFCKESGNVEENNKFTFTSDIEVIRNEAGMIKCVNYYTLNSVLHKSVHYTSLAVESIDNYSNGLLYSTEKYESNLLKRKIVYNKLQAIDYEIKYDYDARDRVTSISKKSDSYSAKVAYVYDDIDRIIERVYYLNNEICVHQEYSYDILNRINRFKDDKYVIDVSQVSRNNDIVSYSIKDNYGNVLNVENYYMKNHYTSSQLVFNGHQTMVKDINYADNINLKVPHVDLADLDLISNSIVVNFSDFNPSDEIKDVNTGEIKNKNVTIVEDLKKSKILPISMRKLYLYKMVASA